MSTSPSNLLRDYRAKRDFAKTREPKGAPSAKSVNGKKLAFVVQKHDARRLHFDFRIELDGVLKSWAVTKGPSNNPSDKRLAVRVEDHPLDYGSFEGTIPKGQYGGGTVMLWDEGYWEPIGDAREGLKNGDLKIRLHGSRLKGEWVLVHMKGRDNGKRENWLLIKHRDDHARDHNTLVDHYTRSVVTARDFEDIAKGNKPKKPPPKKPMVVERNAEASAREKSAPTRKSKAKAGTRPKYQPPQLATLVDDIPTGNDWLFELKYDGYRCLASLSGSDVRLFTRNGKDWTEQFDVIREPLSKLGADSALIDGELCAFNAKGRTDFATLKEALTSGGPLVYFVFDLLELDGKDLKKQPLLKRKELLKKLIGKTGAGAQVQFSEHVRGHGEDVFNKVCAEGHEGIIAKKADAPYRNARTRDWLKIKCTKRQEFVVAGWSPSDRKSTFASLLLGSYDGEKLVYHGRVGTGFSVDDSERIQALLDRLSRKTSPFDKAPPPEIKRDARYVTPQLVAEIAYTELTPDGYLRHPSFIGLREDKDAEAVRLETPVTPPRKPAPKSLNSDAGEKAARDYGVHLTSPDRVAFPDQGVTKGELIAYYAAVGERMLVYAAKRPLSLVRCPQGRAKHCFFQKHDSGGFPDQMKTIRLKENSGKTQDYFYVDDVAGLLAGTQMNVLEWHLWGVSIDALEKPERLIFDIDPDEAVNFSEVKRAAEDVRAYLKDKGLKSFPLVTGGKGIHVIAPLKPEAGWEEVKTFCKQAAIDMAEAEPDRFVATSSKAKRKGKMFIDYLRNERGSTAIAPWSTRSREGAPVAVPVSWPQLKKVKHANEFSLTEALKRAKLSDPWTDYFDLEQTLPT
ncbi:MAG: DNA ligase D [Pseudomonadota bacterium]